MRTTFALLALLASWTSVTAAPTKGEGYIGNAKAGHVSGGKEYVVMFNKSEAIPPQAATILERIDLSPNHSDVKYTFDNGAFKGFVANMGDHCLDALNAMVEVERVEESASMRTHVTQFPGAPWGLQRISNAAGATGGSSQDIKFTYSFDDAKLGAGVDIYIVDTGVRTTHAVFTNGRATNGFSISPDGQPTDGDGHGTHVAGTAAGAKFGVAQNANIIAVKVLGDDGSGSSSDTIAGVDWVINRHNQRKNEQGFVGSIISMSLGLSGIAETLDDAILGAIAQGIHVSVAAGNDATDACRASPSKNGGGASAVLSVGSININNEISSFSNTGSCVDIYAPGEQIVSSWNTGDTIINFLSGTSMATPHVTGTLAYLIAQSPELGQNPVAAKSKLLSLARTNAISGNAISGDKGLLLSNGVDGALKKRWVVPSTDSGDLVEYPQKRAITGSVASWARKIMGTEGLGKRWTLHSLDSPLRL